MSKNWALVRKQSRDSEIYRKVLQTLKSGFNGTNVNCEQIIRELTTNFPDDHSIYLKLRKIFHDAKKNEKMERYQPRQNRMVDEIMKIGDYWSSGLTILDFGCGPGELTSEFASRLKMDEKSMFACDVKKPKVGNWSFDLIEDGKSLPYKDDTFDRILSMMVLHHVKNQEFAITELTRVLKPGGLLFIREHDCTGFDIFLDIVHGLHNFVWQTQIEDDKFCETYFAKYRTANEWHELFLKNNLQHVLTTDSSDKEYHGRIKNPQRQYFAVYKKKLGDK